jgi:hypothetical protein
MCASPMLNIKLKMNISDSMGSAGDGSFVRCYLPMFLGREAQRNVSIFISIYSLCVDQLIHNNS